ncbi:MAG TPA: hypothetical protein PKC43_05610 [Phycisphaerales bacterium]|nr:hypothetical protein [Phycisphaerales bacterium]HMP36908.1 hypothetical protein [Phycisphaerales bacterium]
MSTSYAALCTDFYVNQRIALKLDLPTSRETLLHLFDRVRREHPSMDRFRRYEDELALESPDDRRSYSWVSLRRTSVRSGWVNPESFEQAYRLHRLLLDTTPYFLSISPLDIDHIELVYGFDFEVAPEINRDEVVFSALLADSPLASLVDRGAETVIDAQPLIGIALAPPEGSGEGAPEGSAAAPGRPAPFTAYVEVKTRARPESPATRGEAEPISVYLTVRRLGAIRSLDECAAIFSGLVEHAEHLADSRVVPHVVAPIHAALLGR